MIAIECVENAHRSFDSLQNMSVVTKCASVARKSNRFFIGNRFELRTRPIGQQIRFPVSNRWLRESDVGELFFATISFH